MTPKQREFARQYAQSQNVVQAAMEAGYSETYANTKAYSQLMKNEFVLAEIKRLRRHLDEVADRSATDVVNEYARIAFTDRVSFLKEDPYFPGEYIYKAPHELTKDQRAIVEKTNLRTKTIKIRDPETDELIDLVRQEYTYVLSDKANALQQMGRHFGIFDDKLKLTSSAQNPFKNATPEQLDRLRTTIIKTMSGEIIDGQYTEEAKNLLPHGKRRTRTG